MIRAVLFDLDGTLLDTLDDLAHAADAACRADGLGGVSREETRARVGNGMRRLIARCLPEDAGDDRIDRVLAAFRAHYDAHMTDCTRPYPGIDALLDALAGRGIRAAVLSNKADPAVCALMEHYFPGRIAVARGEVPGVPRKPDPAGVHAVLERLGCAPDEVLYVGDSDVDMQTARNAGLVSVGVTWGFRAREVLAPLADHLIDDPKELIALIDRKNLEAARDAFLARGFACTIFDTAAEAADYLAAQCAGCAVGFGGSMTLDAMGVYDRLRETAEPHWHWKGDTDITAGDVYLTSANALSATGEIVNIDGACNRVAGSIFGFARCFIVCGANKLAPDLAAAIDRARNVAAPLNARRLAKKTPCAVDGRCHDCRSPERICRVMAVTMAPPMRMERCEVVLIAEELGY